MRSNATLEDLTPEELVEMEALKALIAPLALERMDQEPGGARYRFLTRVLTGIVASHEHALGVLEDLDHAAAYECIPPRRGQERVEDQAASVTVLKQ